MKLEESIRISPADWPDASVKAKPGDLRYFAPAGLGIGGPFPMMPWDSAESFANRPSYYGLQQPSGHPMRDAPLNDANGGIVYFDSNVNREHLEGFLRLLEIGLASREYVAFRADSPSPSGESYITQVRFVSYFALTYFFGVMSSEQCKEIPPQPSTLGDAIWAFIQHQEETWGVERRGDLEGMFGGDGDWARERLAFGFMLENSYNRICRVWSRAWLVTK